MKHFYVETLVASSLIVFFAMAIAGITYESVLRNQCRIAMKDKSATEIAVICK